ncbi:hypothetical protein [Desulfonatronum thioautotrophicum]|uniref:hypothetical protein n=1 Tax=Desulfonatronum thioautotrophicum TaxID=617001 RepID=UPI0005EBB25C|nr:hypothetical protein [Desulfonatronum thioautotrophicum]
MANLTITVDEYTLKKARIRALEQDTSVNALLREYLECYAGSEQLHRDAVQKIMDISDTAESGRGGRTWSREELHERPGNRQAER